MNGQEFSKQLNSWKTRNRNRVSLLPVPIQMIIIQYAVCDQCEVAKKIKLKYPNPFGCRVSIDLPHMYYHRETLEIAPSGKFMSIHVDFEVEKMSCYSCGGEFEQEECEISWSKFISCIAHNVSIIEYMRTDFHSDPCTFESWNTCELEHELYKKFTL